MDGHLTALWKVSLKGAVCPFHQRQKTGPKLKYWHYKAFRDEIHNSTDENKLFGQTSEKDSDCGVVQKGY